MPPLIRVGQRPIGSYRNPDAMPHAQRAVASVTNSTGTRSANPFGRNVVTAGSAGTDRYNPVHESLDKDSLLDDIIPKSDMQLAKLFDKIYRDDAIAGSAVDFISTFSWSDYTLTGIKDPEKMKLFMAAMEMLQPVTKMPLIEGDALRQGRSISTLLFDEEQATWSDILFHPPMYCEITPLITSDPMIDVFTPPYVMDMLKLKDPRAVPAQQKYPEKLRKAFLSGKAQLDPLTTMFVPRRVSTTDYKGTSIYWRILPYYAIEKALLQSTIANARRRTRSILHVQAGIDNVWEPTDAELSDLTAMFVATEEDPAGAVIATRSGIQTTEIRQGSDHWKVSEEQDSLRTAKLAALGVSDAMISGDANFNTVDASMTMFVESKKVSRAHYTREIIYNRLFAQLCRVHGFLKNSTSHADASHGIRTGNRGLVMATPSVEDAMKIPLSELEMPRVHWTKNLSPQSDNAYLDVLDRAKQNGVPVTVSMWASAAGIDLNQLMEQLPDDKRLRAKLAKYAPAPADAGGGGGWGGGGGGGGAFGSVQRERAYVFEADYLGITALASAVGVDGDRRVLGLAIGDVVDFVDDCTTNSHTMAIFNDWPALQHKLVESFHDDNAVDAMKYLLNRAGYTTIPVPGPFLLSVAETIATKANVETSKERLRFLRSEIVVIGAIYTRTQEREGHTTEASYASSRARERMAVAETSARRVLRSFTGINESLPRHQLYSGLIR